MLSGLGNLAGLMKSAKDLQANMAKMQEELAKKRYEGEAGGGMVRAVVDGKFQVIDVKIDPEAASDVELLEDLVKAAVSVAIKNAQEGMRNELTSLTGGMNIPGLTSMLGGGV